MHRRTLPHAPQEFRRACRGASRASRRSRISIRLGASATAVSSAAPTASILKSRPGHGSPSGSNRQGLKLQRRSSLLILRQNPILPLQDAECSRQTACTVLTGDDDGISDPRHLHLRYCRLLDCVAALISDVIVVGIVIRDDWNCLVAKLREIDAPVRQIDLDYRP